ncbi:hypothetical protein HEK616_48370 [Streptomyces nigrescens]|uniref:Uncharacterized protein n=1 Tax=Streptomyces nigrescens TaxID=1920 RepID=A0ABM7ZY87_STRNI|nr:hypothetical protein HEK616_48370 [Streptomyces nigrescens]
MASAGTLVTGAPSGERRRAVAAGARWTRGADDAERGAAPGPCGAAGRTGVVPAGGGEAGCPELRGALGAPSGRAEAGCGRAGTTAWGAESRDAAVGGAGTEATGAPRPVLGASRLTLRCTDRPGAERAGFGFGFGFGGGLGFGFGLARDVADAGGLPAGELPAGELPAGELPAGELPAAGLPAGGGDFTG